MAEIIEQRVEKTSFGDIGKNIGDEFFLFMEVLAGDGEKRDAVGAQRHRDIYIPYPSRRKHDNC